jgi:hypothetical protein
MLTKFHPEHAYSSLQGSVANLWEHGNRHSSSIKLLTSSMTIIFAKGRAIAQAVCRWLPTAAARVRARVWSCGICGGQSGARVGFLRVLRFPLPIFIPPIAPQSPSSITWGLYNRPEVAAVPSGHSPTPLKKSSLQNGL